MGIGGAKVALNVNPTFPKDTTTIEGSFKVTSKSDLLITNMKVEFEEDYETGTGDNKTSKTYTWGTQEFKEQWNIKAGEEKEFSFSFPISRPLSQNQEMAEKGGVVGGLGKLASFASGEKSKYFVNVVVDAKGVALDASDKKQVKFA